MGTISARKIEESLSKARDVGYVEEPFQIGDTSLVMRNLRPDHFKAIFSENEDLEGVDHVYAFQQSHISRSICEINGTDLRTVDFVEVEEQSKDPKTKEPLVDSGGAPVLKKVKLELHAYLRQYILCGWSKEAMLVAWRKFCDVLKLAEDKAKEGIKFVLPEETPEETFRRTVATIQEAMSGVPEPLIESILEEAGLMRISTAEEIKKAMQATDQLAREQAAAQQAQETQEQQAQGQQGQGQPDTGVRQVSVREIMASRQPLNQEPVTITHPSQEPTIARNQPVQQPVQYQQPQVQHQEQPPPVQPPPLDSATILRAAQRSQKIGKLEDGPIGLEPPMPPPGDPNMARRHVAPGQPHVTPGQTPQGATTQPNAPHLRTARPEDVPVLAQKGREAVNLQEFNKIVEQPPRAGINPRFRPPR
jgi:hypothetical protein